MKTAAARRRRALTVSVLICVAVASAAGLGSGLVSCGPPKRSTITPVEQPLSAAETRLLADARQHNLQDGYVGFRAVISDVSGDVHVDGWIDWRRPLIYLNSQAARPGAADGLIQATPELLASHPGRPAGPMPPLVPPTDGWRVRRLVPAGSGSTAFDTLLQVLFSIRRVTPDSHPAGARFVRHDRLDGDPVTVVDVPAVPSASAAPAGGLAVRYWLTADGHLLRCDARLTADRPVRVDFIRTDHTRPTAIELLGGSVSRPRAVTAAEARTLAELPRRDHSAGGGILSVTLPIAPIGLMRGTGWLDWRAPSAYLGLHDLDDPTQDQLVQADELGVSERRGTRWSGRPPLTAPSSGWQSSSWQQRSVDGPSDLDILLDTVLTLTGHATTAAEDLRRTASYLRSDTVGGVPVTVYEIRQPDEQRAAAGQGRLRYWLDRAGTLRRLELRTSLGAYAYLDVTPGSVPELPQV